MNDFIISLLFLLLFPVGTALSQLPDPVADFPVEFKDKAMVHVRSLCVRGERRDGTRAADRAVAYIENQFRDIGLEIQNDTFSYSAFEAKKTRLLINGKKMVPKRIILDPYQGNLRFTGSFLFFYPDSSLAIQMMQDLAGRIIVTKDPADYFSLSARNPRAVIVLEKKDFDSLIRSGIPPESHGMDLIFSGRVKKIRSVNVVGILKPVRPDTGEIILSAHWDSFNASGADNNASGVATLIELARYFSRYRSELTTTLKFVSFGAEEMGTIGSVAYVDHHSSELSNCRLMFNIDGVSGLWDIYVDVTGKVENSSPVKGIIRQKLYFRNRALCGKAGNWFRIEEYPLASNVPAWLRRDVISVCNALYTRINQVSGISSDHQSFALAGIPSTSISIDNGIETHSSSDVPEKVHSEGMWIAGRIVAGVVVKSMSGSESNP